MLVVRGLSLTLKVTSTSKRKLYKHSLYTREEINLGIFLDKGNVLLANGT